MHDTAYGHGRLFFEQYWSDAFQKVVELGSQDVNGSLRDHCPPKAQYIGLDMVAAKGVDLVVAQGESLPIASGSVDVVVTSSAFEHDTCFWDTFLELVRILRPGGLLYVNAPSNHHFHRYPLDCWRFYPDAGIALVRWAERRAMPIELVESFVALPKEDGWADFVAVFRKTGGPSLVRKGRIADRTQAINIYDLEMQVGTQLQAETLRMPDTEIAAGLAAELAARKVDLEAAMHSNTTLLADLSIARADAAKLSEKLHGAALRIAELEKAQAEAIEQQVIGMRNIEAVQATTLWRMTAPLRWLVIAVRGR
jgi:SAM-dependent methyltransferase